MDFTLSAPVSAFATTFLLLAILYSILFKNKSSEKPPEAGGAWPIIGHLHLLTGARPSFKILGDMADKYGPIFQIRLGEHKVLVVSDARVAKECFTVNDKALAGRPKSLSSEIMGYNYATFGLASYGPYWREVRKFVVQELLTNRRIDMLKHIRESEVKSFTKNIYQTWLKNKNESAGVKLDMKELYGKLTMDVMTQTLFRQRYEEKGSQTVTTINRFFYLMGLFVVSDYLPWLRWLDIGGHEKAMKEIAKELDSVMEGWLQEHKRKRHKSKEEEDFMDALLSHFDDDKDIPRDFDAATIVKATCLIIFSAAIDSTTATLTWAFSLIMNNYSVLEKIQGELDHHVGKERHVNTSDINNLTYLQAVVKETLRLYPPGPLLVQHEAIEDCVVNGYHVSKGMRLLVNASKIHRDPNFWSNPNAFRPERFLSEHKEVDVRGNNFELIPFSSGRRVCPGMPVALQMVEFALASLIHGFDLKRISDESIDMTESDGLVNFKATPLFVLLSPRLPTHLYN